MVSVSKIQELEKEKEEKQKVAERMSIEKDMWMRKANNLKKSPMISRLPTPVQDRVNSDEGETDISPIRLDANKIINKRQIIQEINSDVENMSLR